MRVLAEVDAGCGAFHESWEGVLDVGLERMGEVAYSRTIVVGSVMPCWAKLGMGSKLERGGVVTVSASCMSTRVSSTSSGSGGEDGLPRLRSDITFLRICDMVVVLMLELDRGVDRGWRLESFKFKREDGFLKEEVL